MPMDPRENAAPGEHTDDRWWIRSRHRVAEAQRRLTTVVTWSVRRLTALPTVPKHLRGSAEERRLRLVIAGGVIAVMGVAALGSTDVDRATPGAVDLAITAQSDAAERKRAEDRAARASRFLEREPLREPVHAPRPRQPRPTAGYGPTQMENARLIVEAGQEMGVPWRAMVIAVATAMQESNLLNRANEGVPESKNYPHQATGWDHDSVGLFQQRPSTGWGAVKDLMDPKYAARQFYQALLRVPGWERMALTDAAQRVQVSAFPYHYAKHEGNAEAVVSEILAAQQGEE